MKLVEMYRAGVVPNRDTLAVVASVFTNQEVEDMGVMVDMEAAMEVDMEEATEVATEEATAEVTCHN